VLFFANKLYEISLKEIVNFWRENLLKACLHYEIQQDERRGHVTYIREIRNAYRILAGNLEGKG
jgi:hypothetical protein